MTHIHITNADNTLQPVPNKYYIEIEATKLEFDDQIVMQNTLEYPKEQSDQTAASDTYFIDLQKRAHIVNITGRIDKYANRDSNWSALVVQDVSVVRKRLQYMLDRGGTHKLYIGLNDGYYNRANTATENEVYDVAILKINFTEEAADHVDKTTGDENYPSGVSAKIMSYDIIMQCRIGTLLPLG